MTDATTGGQVDAGTAASDASNEWLDLVDQVLLGLDHALNNRLGALRAFAELLKDEHWRTTSAASESVQKELARLEGTTSVVRLLARPRHRSETGLILEDVMTDVIRIQAMLHDVRDTPIDFVPGPPLEPVWSERSALIRLLSLVLYDLRRKAGSATAAGGGALRVSTDSDEYWVRIGLTSTAPADECRGAVTDHVASLASSIGAECHWIKGQLELRLPTLKSHRARAPRAL